MTIDSLIKILDRFGLPTLFIAVMGWLAYLFVKGPAMRLAERFGDGFSVLAKAGVEFLQSMTASVAKTHVEHVELKAHVSAESTAIREHVTASVTALHTRIEATKGSIEGTVRTSAADHASTSAHRAAAPPLSERGQATCEQ